LHCWVKIIDQSNKKNTMQIGDIKFDESDDNAKLGTGAFGSVYRGSADTIGQVAVKKLQREDAKLEELTAVRQLNNKHICRILDVLFDPTHCYVVMELCDCDLSAFLELSGSLSATNFDTVMQGLAVGYKALHDINIIHRDIKPANILLKYHVVDEEDSQVKIIDEVKIGDFGSSRLTDTKLNSKLIGTPMYMAPEIGASVLDNVEYDCQVDMWSIGVVLHECLTGQIPFDEQALCRMFLFAANRNYQGYHMPPTFPECAEDYKKFIINSLLQLDPSKRLTPSEFYCAAVHHPKLRRSGSMSLFQRNNDQTLVLDCSKCADANQERKTFFDSTLRLILFYTALLCYLQNTATVV
ncbi:Serine/threonine-protein kinase ULK3, partial [Trichinella britovi]